MVRAIVERLRRHERALWIALLLGIVAVRWPLLKGFYYRAAHVAAPGSTIPWRTDLDEALAEARRTGRPVLADFGASWCPPCLAMQHDVWPDASVERAVTSGYVPLAVDVDRNGPVAERYHIDTIPSVLVLDGRGQIVRRAGYLPVSGMLRFLDRR